MSIDSNGFLSLGGTYPFAIDSLHGPEQQLELFHRDAVARQHTQHLDQQVYNRIRERKITLVRSNRSRSLRLPPLLQVWSHSSLSLGHRSIDTKFTDVLLLTLTLTSLYEKCSSSYMDAYRIITLFHHHLSRIISLSSWNLR